MHDENKFKLEMEFEPLINYESILCVKFPDTEDKVNAACMGVHFTSNNEVYIHAYEKTHTRAILKPGVIFSINFSENFYEYTIAGLKVRGKDEKVDELPKDFYRTLNPAPILKSAWCSVICEVIKMPDVKFIKPVCRRRQAPNIRAKIKEIKTYRFPKIFNNRSMNLALEALILATRIPLYEKNSKKYKDSLRTYLIIKKKIDLWRDMNRFDDGFEVIDNYLIKKNVKAKELFDF